jgi:hypothetical protein
MTVLKSEGGWRVEKKVTDHQSVFNSKISTTGLNGLKMLELKKKT